MGIDRRKFLKGMGSLALFSIVPSKVLGGPNHIAPSDQLTKGIIGVGGIGRSSYHFTSNEQCARRNSMKHCRHITTFAT